MRLRQIPSDSRRSTAATALFGASRGYKADIQPESFTIVEGKLYLNHSAPVQQTWLKDTGSYIRKADPLWAQTQKVDKVLK